MSGEDENFVETEESEADFSASEDEWKPENTITAQTDSDSNEDVDDDFEEAPPKKNKRFSLNISHQPQPRNRNGRISLSLNATKNHISLTKNVKNSKSTNNKKTENDEESDSGSSGDDCLVDPNKIDFQSSFFNRNTSAGSNNNTEKEPVFECDGGMDLSDSDDNEMEVVDGGEHNSFKNFFDFNKNVENVKNQVKMFEAKKTIEQNIDVSSLLAMGESSKQMVKDTRKKLKHDKNNPEHSDSDWEEVEDHKAHETTANERDLQVTVAQPHNEQRVKKVTDEQASLMRQLNRVIKENHVIAHKVSLLCHIAHGVYLNRALNNINLMGEALKLLPNKNCYPDGRTNIKYFESIIKWYKSIMKIKSDQMYTTLKKRPPIPLSLAIQMKYRETICKKDFILIFIVLLRAMGIQCRLIMNLVPLPLKPAQSDLCTITMKKPIEKNQEKKNQENKNIPSKKIPVKGKEKEPNCEKNTNKKSKKDVHFEKEHIIDSPMKTRKQSQANQKSKSSEAKNVDGHGHKKVTPIKDNKKTSLKEKIDRTVRSKKTDLNSQENIVPPKANVKIKKDDIVNIKTNIPDIKITGSEISSETNKAKTNTKKSSKSTIKNNQNKNRSPSPKFHISPLFTQSKSTIEEVIDKKLSADKKSSGKTNLRKSNSPTTKIHISPLFTQTKSNIIDSQITVESNQKSSSERRKSTRKTLSVPQMDGGDDEVNMTSKKSLSKQLQKVKLKRKSSNDDSDEDFEVSPPKKSKPSTSSKPLNKAIERVKLDRRVLSTDGEESPKKTNKNPVDIWIEVYCEMEEQWITIELFKGKVHCVDSIRKQATSPIAYVFAWNNDNSLKDVSPRYCPQWNTTTRKMRVEKEWLNEAIRPFRGKKNVRDKAEDRELEKIHLDKPLPQTISEYKNHPLYALKRHLLKFEAIYPPNAVTLGFVRGEPVYPRDCIHTLHSREIWLKSARVVKPGQQPYKIVKARPKWDKINSKVIKDLPLEIFGYWQTMDYEPPTAENGIVPRNAYGNVELFKACMLPKKTVHLTLPGLNRVCKKLQIDCAPAVIGFDFHQGSCHPLLDGFVVCEEFADLVVDAWHKDQEEMERREEEKFQQRVYGNWKKLIKGLLIRQRLKLKYNFDDVGEGTSGTSKRQKKN